MINNNYYHPKAAFSLFLNQAENNVEIALQDIFYVKKAEKYFSVFILNLMKKKVNILKEDDKKKLINETINKLETNYFPFLKNEKNKKENEYNNEEKFDILFKLILILDRFRNYFSHYYYKENYKQNGKQIYTFNITDDEKNIIDFLENKFNQAVTELSETKYINNKESLKLLNQKNKHYNFFYKNKEKGFTKFNNNNYTFKAIVFITNFFLTKRQANLFISKIKGFKDTRETEKLASRDVFTHFHMHNNSIFNSSDPQIKYFFDAVTHLSKIPKVVEDNLRLPCFKNQYASRTNKDKFTHFALQFIDDFELFRDIRFKIFTNIETEEEIKIYHNKTSFKREINKRKTVYSRINEINKNDKSRYEIRNNNIYFQVNGKEIYIITLKDIAQFCKKFKYNKKDDKIKTLEVDLQNKKFDKKALENSLDFLTSSEKLYILKLARKELKGSMSIYEFRNLAYALLLKNNYKIHFGVINYLENYRNILIDILEGNDINIENLNIEKKDFPEYLQKVFSINMDTENDYKKNVLNKLIYIKSYSENLCEEKDEIKKYDKIKEIMRFVCNFLTNNKFQSTKEHKYIDKDQHDQIMIYLGSLPKNKDEFLNYLINQEIEVNCKTKNRDFDFYDMLKETQGNENTFLHNLFRKINYVNIKWCEDKIIRINNDKNLLDETAKILNIKPKNYNSNIKESISRFLIENIAIPRGFIKKHFFKEETSSLTELINKQKPDNYLAPFYSEIRKFKKIKNDYKSDKKIYQEKAKDKLLFVIVEKYLKEKISKNINNSISIEETDITKILNKDITIIIENKRIKFALKDYHKINELITDNRLVGILKNDEYFTRELFTGQEKKYEFFGNGKNEIKNPLKDKKNEIISYVDIKKMLNIIENQQFQIINKILKLEKNILINSIIKKTIKKNNGKIYKINKNIIEYHIDKIEHELLSEKENNNYKKYEKEKIETVIKPLLNNVDEKNRIETRYIFEELANPKINFDSCIEGNKTPIVKYRNTAFHNNIPEFGTFEDGILLLNTELKKQIKMK